jgi:hypothetical protein
MAGRLALGLALALAAAACGNAPPSPSPVATPASTWDPRRDEITQAQGIWEAEQPPTYAYTLTAVGSGTGAAVNRVTHMDGHTEIQVVQVSTFMDASGLTIEGMFANALAGLGGDDRLTIAIDPQYGYPTSVERADQASTGSTTTAVSEFTTPGDRTAKARATDALTQLLDRWHGLSAPDWEYRWTRVDAASSGAPTGWVVRHEDGATTALAAGSTAAVAPPSEVTIDGTVQDVVGVMGAGGWIDVSADAQTGLDAVIAVDPSPAVKGDGYWIRIDFTDRGAARQKELLDAARARWTAAKVKKATYQWAYDGERGAWTLSIAATGGTVKVLRRSPGAPSGDTVDIRPAVTAAFDAIDEILSTGGTVAVTYDKALGYPKKIVVGNGGTAGWPKGTISITKFKIP